MIQHTSIFRSYIHISQYQTSNLKITTRNSKNIKTLHVITHPLSHSTNSYRTFTPLGNEEDTNVNLTQTLFLTCWCWIQGRKSEPPKRNLGLWDLRGGESPHRHCVSITALCQHWIYSISFNPHIGYIFLIWQLRILTVMWWDHSHWGREHKSWAQRSSRTNGYSQWPVHGKCLSPSQILA